MPRRVRMPIATMCALVAALAGLAALAAAARAGARRGHAARHPAPCAGAALEPNAGDLAAVENATLCLVDRIREAHDLARLRPNASLAHAAARKVARMLHLDYFADGDPAHLTPLSLVFETSYPARAHAVSVGQNIAWGTGADASPANVVAAWMDSPPHRAIILTPSFRDAGIAARPAVPSVVSSADGATYAMEFGARSR